MWALVVFHFLSMACLMLFCSTFSILVQQISGVLSTGLPELNLKEIIEYVRIDAAIRFEAYQLNDRVNIPPRANPVPARIGEAAVQQGRIINVQEAAAAEGFMYNLPLDIKKKISMCRFQDWLSDYLPFATEPGARGTSRVVDTVLTVLMTCSSICCKIFSR
jgi:hypothetical protein